MPLGTLLRNRWLLHRWRRAIVVVAFTTIRSSHRRGCGRERSSLSHARTKTAGAALHAAARALWHHLTSTGARPWTLSVWATTHSRPALRERARPACTTLAKTALYAAKAWPRTWHTRLLRAELPRLSRRWKRRLWLRKALSHSPPTHLIRTELPGTGIPLTRTHLSRTNLSRTNLARSDAAPSHRAWPPLARPNLSGTALHRAGTNAAAGDHLLIRSERSGLHPTDAIERAAPSAMRRKPALHAALPALAVEPLAALSIAAPPTLALLGRLRKLLWPLLTPRQHLLRTLWRETLSTSALSGAPLPTTTLS